MNNLPMKKVLMAASILFSINTLQLKAQDVVINNTTETHQESKQKYAEFGIRFMPTFSKFDLKNSSGGTVKGRATLGFGAGAFFGFNFTNHIGVQAEMIYSSSSQKYSELNIERKVTLKYVNIPLLLSLNTGKMKTVNLNVVGGPQIGISAGSDVTTTGSDGSAHSTAILAVKKSDIGIAYGFGLDLALNDLKTLRVGLGYRGVIGLFDISSDSKTTSNDSFYVIDKTHLSSSAFYIGVSILF